MCSADLSLQSESPLFILYGSATGNAEQIAKDLAGVYEGLINNPDCYTYFPSVVCYELNDFKKKCQSIWEQEPSGGSKHGVLIVSSTTGNGDAPENADRFVRYLKRKTTVDAMPFRHCSFAVLGLGDTNYDYFCNTGKIIDKKLGELGGTRCRDLVCADEATGLEDSVDPWVDSILSEINSACRRMEVPTGKQGEQKEDSASVAPASGVVETSTVKSKSPLYIMYGSATGNAEHIAKDLAGQYESLLKNPDAKTFFSSTMCCELNDFKKKCQTSWEEEPENGAKHGILVVTSTTGNGDAPENADRFVRYIKRKSTAETMPFRHCAFAVLALGDTNYDYFCNTGKIVDKKMGELGGTRFHDLVCADEATGLEDTVDPWAASILSKINTYCPGTTVSVADVQVSASVKASPVMEEEKKNENDGDHVEEAPTNAQGVSTVYSCSTVTSVDSTLLPPVGALLSQCKLVSGSAPVAAESSMSKNVASEASEDPQYTLAEPFNSTVVGARYLTATSAEAAKKVSELIQANALHDEMITTASSIFEDEFPIAASNGTVHDKTTLDQNGKRVIEMRFALPDDKSFQYQPGDSIGLVVSNTPSAVNFVLEMAKKQGISAADQMISIDENSPISLKEALCNHFDLCTPIKNKRTLHALSKYATHSEEAKVLRFLASKDVMGKKAFDKYVAEQRMTIVDILRDFPSCQSIEIASLLGLLLKARPRYYSVSSSPLATEKPSLTVSFSVVDYMTPSLLVGDEERGCRRIGGLATRYMEMLCSPFLCGRGNELSTKAASFRIFPKPSLEFHLPASNQTPLILIGPGTGVAPFMSFLAHREATGSTQDSGSIDLFFGCRHQNHDWLYQKEMIEWKERGIISNLNTAFSRDGDKKYVQDLMRDNCSSRLLSLLLEQDGAIYVCGDGNAMAKDVRSTLLDVLSTKLSGGKEEATSFLQKLKEENRYLQDIWSG